MEKLKNEKLKELLENLDDNSIISIWNEYCDNNYYDDERIFEMYEFDDLFSNNTPLEILDRVNSDFNTSDDYFQFGIYGCESFSYVSDKIYYDDLANYILDNDEDFSNDDIREFLDENADDSEL